MRQLRETIKYIESAMTQSLQQHLALNAILYIPLEVLHKENGMNTIRVIHNWRLEAAVAGFENL